MLISRKALIPKVQALVAITKSLTAERVQGAIRNALSMAKGTSAKKLTWELARQVSALGRVSHANAKRICKVWFLEAKKSGREMGSFREHWQDFRQAIPKVKYPTGACLAAFCRKAIGEGPVKLRSLLDVLSHYHGGEFALSSEALAENFGVHQTTISRWLRHLVEDGVLEVAKDCSYRGAESRVYRLKTRKNPSFPSNAYHAGNSSERSDAEPDFEPGVVCEERQKAGLEKGISPTALAEIEYLRWVVSSGGGNVGVANSRLYLLTGEVP